MTDSGIERAIGVGHSLGGGLTVLAAAANAELFRGLVLVGPVIFTGLHALFWGTRKGLWFGHRPPRFGVRESAASASRALRRCG